MREKILQILRENADRFVSGEEISRQIYITRAAVWKHMQALQKSGIEMEAVRRKGYRLMGIKENAMSTAALIPYLQTKWLGRNAVFLKSAPSSNLVAKKMAAQGAAHGTIVVVEEQTEGRGRRGRRWVNEPYRDICVSAVLRPHMESQKAPRYTLSTALSVYRLAKELALSPAIKWPNDVLLNNKKICGILLEMEGTIEAVSHIVVGFGLNINTGSFPEELKTHATSLLIEGGKAYDRVQVLAQLLNIMEPMFEACENGDFNQIMKVYLHACETSGRDVTVTGIRETKEGVAIGVDDIGRLKLRVKDGRMYTVTAGDVTLRKGSH